MFSRILGILIICASFAIGWVMWDLQKFTQTPIEVEKPGIDYTLKPGTSMAGLARDLAANGVISNPIYLRLLARYNGKGSRIKAGEYRLKPGMLPDNLLDLFVSGRVNTYNITLVEGWNFKQMLKSIHANRALKHTLIGLTDEQIMEQVGHKGEHPEGRFLADTYNFPKGTTDLDLLKRAYNSMRVLLQREWDKRDKKVPFKKPYEALILASIVEKETALASERPLIAGVFVRRLKKRMRLQTDPTVIYGMGDKYSGNIRRKDLRTDTPYNTYTRHGLPPTPISMPGRDAINAVMHPAPGKALYFVAKGQGDGSHAFSDNLKQHNRAVRKYQLKR